MNCQFCWSGVSLLGPVWNPHHPKSTEWTKDDIQYGRFVWVVMLTHLRILGIFFAYKCLSHQDFHPNGSGLANVRQHRMKKELFRWGNAVRMGWKWVKPTDAFPCPLLNQFGPNFSDGWIIVKDDPIDWSPSWSLGRALCFSWPQPTSKWLSGRLSSSSWDLWFF
jgi:hypothetical protein